MGCSESTEILLPEHSRVKGLVNYIGGWQSIDYIDSVPVWSLYNLWAKVSPMIDDLLIHTFQTNTRTLFTLHACAYSFTGNIVRDWGLLEVD